MTKQLTYEDILDADQAYLYGNDVLYIVDRGNNVYGYTKNTAKWVCKENFWDYFESSPTPARFTLLSINEAAGIYLGWTKDQRAENHRLDMALEYAVRHHAGQFRKGTTRPYIMHPIEVMQILHSMKADLNLLIAGVLHDTIEDTSATEDEIRKLFSDDIADLVASHSEDKSKSWLERKQHTIDELVKADKRLKMLVMADKVSNLRSMVSDHQIVHQNLWNRFNAPPEQQAWYYNGVLNALQELSADADCSTVYQEMKRLYEDLFVRFYYDPQQKALYRESVDGVHCYKQNTKGWEKFPNQLPENAIHIRHLYTDMVEDVGKNCFWIRYEQDLADAVYRVFDSEHRHVSFTMSDKQLTLSCHDFGSECEIVTGDDGYTFYYQLDKVQTDRFWSFLRGEYGLEKTFNTLLTERFGTDQGPAYFSDFCKKHNISMRFASF